ncbi:MAG: hypothetical protein M1827_002682 [Pycnora praestabilis]|nr:MAG: hypothetical protein M1827_002682 [Pycnora praestabilis]
MADIRDQIEFEFKIHGKGSLHADGMAMWLTKQRGLQGPVFGSADRFEGLGIFFDTYKNNRPGVVFPYVMAMVGDGQTPYDHQNDGKANELAGCSARGLRGATVPTKARLTYYQDRNLRLDLQYKNEDDWIKCFEVDKVSIPSVTYLGFSAETGELSDNHDIVKVDTRNLYQAPAYSGPSGSSGKQKGKSYDPNRASSGGSWVWFFVKIVLFFAVCGGGYTGFTMWRASNRGSRF